ncbi:MAG: sodium:solute symporter family protein, partial [Verrucomicrobiales bacterium]|nr:sodium:solute symporter family protein [Verrucomicrobiales bacterium]
RRAVNGSGGRRMTQLYIIAGYLALLLGLGLFSSRLFKGTSKDYMLASHSIGPVLLLMSIFGTTMTAFALVGSTGKAFERGVGVYGLMASSSSLIHAACFFLIGIKLWSFGKKYGYVTQIQFFRDRFQSNRLGYLLFPILVGLVVPYLLIGVMGAGKVIGPMTTGLFPEAFPGVAGDAQSVGAIPPWLTGLVICGVVLAYVFSGGSRAAAWANTFQTIVFMCMGILAFVMISKALGGIEAAIQQANAGHLVRSPSELVLAGGKVKREVGIPPLMFASYMFIPLSVGMFPHLFQHWLTAKSARSFKLTVIAHPLCIMIVWVPCVLIGLWATGSEAGMPPLPSEKVGAVLSIMVKKMIGDPLIIGLITAGILAAIMSSLDSQFLCLGTMFTNDIVLHAAGEGKYNDKQIVMIARAFVVVIVAVTYVLSILGPKNIFDMAVWSFSGFASLTPLVIAALYWKRSTKVGAYASILAAMGVWGYYFRASGWGGEYTVYGGVMPVAISFAAGALAMVVFSLLSRPPEEAVVRKFFPERLS